MILNSFVYNVFKNKRSSSDMGTQTIDSFKITEGSETLANTI
jgi:hypothetical protein